MFGTTEAAALAIARGAGGAGPRRARLLLRVVGGMTRGNLFMEGWAIPYGWTTSNKLPHRPHRLHVAAM